MLFSHFFIILLNSVFISTAIHDSKKTEQNDIEEEMNDERIIGGRDVVDGERPFQVALLSNGQFICGGSRVETPYLKDRVVVTAAHCVAGYDLYFTFILNKVNQVLK
jgi:secreted trypsin-like serine protease